MPVALKVAKMIESQIEPIIKKACPDGFTAPINIKATRDSAHGDYCTNFAIVQGDTEEARMDMANNIAQAINDLDAPFNASVAKPGFVNFQIRTEVCWQHVCETNKAQTLSELLGPPESAQSYMLEFVSANPTGPISVVNGRAACLGDTLSKVLKSTGHGVQTEFYVNDGPHSTQLKDLVGTVDAYYRAWVFNTELDEDQIKYAGEYVKLMTTRILQDYAGELVRLGTADRLRIIEDYVVDYITEWQKDDLLQIGISYDKWFYESYLFQSGALEVAFETLKRTGQTFQSDDGATWLKLPSGDKVICRADGRFTYFMTDIAYHLSKLARCEGRLINIWGADHLDHRNSLCDALTILGHDRLTVLFTQMVSMRNNGVTVIGSKRAGQIEELYEDLTLTIGKDAARFVFSSVSPSSQMVIDTSKLIALGKENPVYYIQYAHARLCSIMRKAEAMGVSASDAMPVELPPELKRAILALTSLPEVIETSVSEFIVHNLNEYVVKLAGFVHNAYEREQIITENAEESASRLFAITAIQKTLAWCLDLLGMTAPEKM